MINDIQPAHEFKVRKLEQCKLTVNIKVTRELKIRVAIAGLLIRLGAWVLGSNININFEDRQKK